LSLNWWLDPQYGGYGAAVSQCLSYLFVAIVTWFVSRRYMPFEPAWPRLIGCFLALGAVAIYIDSALADGNEFVSVAVKTIVFMFMSPATLAWSLRMSLADLLRITAQLYRRAAKRVSLAI
jgi:hypothetical protein